MKNDTKTTDLDKENNFSSATIEECPHDIVPYTTIENSLIRDESISPNCRWLIIYLLSNKAGWKISVKQVINHLIPFMSRKKVYALFKEAIDSGYMDKKQIKDGSKFGMVKYFVARTPKFKKCFPLPQNEHAQNEQAQKGHTKEITSISKDIPIKEKQYKECPPSAASAAADFVASFFYEKIKEDIPDIKVNISKWAKEVEKMIRIDQRDSEEIKKLIEFSRQTKWYKSNVLSPFSLRKQYIKMREAMKEEEQSKRIQKNRLYALRLKDKYPVELRQLSFDDRFAMNLQIGKELKFDMDCESFKNAFASLFGAERRNG